MTLSDVISAVAYGLPTWSALYTIVRRHPRFQGDSMVAREAASRVLASIHAAAVIVVGPGLCFHPAVPWPFDAASLGQPLLSSHKQLIRFSLSYFVFDLAW